jgi:hypothetical protein
LLAAQVAVAQFLLAGSGLVIRNYIEQQQIRPGFDTSRSLAIAGVVRMNGSLNVDLLTQKLRSIPGTRQVTYAMRLPLGASGGGMRQKIMVPGVTPEAVSTGWTAVGPHYFDVMGTRILTGREFDENEGAHAAVVNETMARKYWGSPEAALGRFFRTDDEEVQITGIAEDGKYADLLERTQPWMFLPPPRRGWGEAVLVADLSRDARSALPEVRRAIREADPDLTIMSLNTLPQHMRIALFLPQVSAWVLPCLALLGASLAAVAFMAPLRTRSRAETTKSAFGCRSGPSPKTS